MTPDDMKTLKRINRVLGIMRTSISPTVPVQVVQAFVAVALNEGKSLTEIAQICGGNLSTTSRHLLDLGERNRKKEPGYGLVHRAEDAEQLRKNNYTLTPRGRLLAAQLAAVLED